jgi:hypothetical protein
MAAIAIQEIPEGGLADVTFVAANTSDTVAAGSKRYGGFANREVVLIYRNTDASTEAITVGSLAPVTIAATPGFAMIPVPNTGINGGVVTCTMASATGITVAAVAIGTAY